MCGFTNSGAGRRPENTSRARSAAPSDGYTQSMTDMTTIKVSVETRDRLKKLADEDHLTLDAELAQTLDQAEDQRFWAGVRADGRSWRAGRRPAARPFP